MWFLAIHKHPQQSFAHLRPHCSVLVALDRRQWSHQNIMIGQSTTKHKHYTDRIFLGDWYLFLIQASWWQDGIIIHNHATLYLAFLTDIELNMCVLMSV
jgi:hypothetical protein